MAEIKICGITDLDDALAAAGAGADAVGFIFYPRSPRCVSPRQALGIIRELPCTVAKVGVFVNDDPERIEEIAAICGLDPIQPHGGETPDYCRRFPAPRVIKAFSPRTADDLEGVGGYQVRAILVDAFAPGLYGGTGKTSNWDLARTIGERYPLILSGGLNSGNIRDAIESVRPQAVDINSGVESSPGRKDHNKIREIIGMIRRYDPNSGKKETTIFKNDDGTVR